MQRLQPILRRLDAEDLLSGILIIAIAVLVLWTGRTYPVGTAGEMGPGYFPRALGWLLVALGLAVALSGLRREQVAAEEPVEVERLRIVPLILVPLSYVAFGYLLADFGLIVASIALIVVAGYAAPGRRPLELVWIGLPLLVLAFFIWYVVGIPVKLFPGA